MSSIKFLVTRNQSQQNITYNNSIRPIWYFPYQFCIFSTINISTTPRQSASHPQIYYKDSTHQSRSTTTSHAKSETSKICFKDLSQEELKSESDYVDLEALADDSNMDKSIHYRDCHICFHLQVFSFKWAFEFQI